MTERTIKRLFWGYLTVATAVFVSVLAMAMLSGCAAKPALPPAPTSKPKETQEAAAVTVASSFALYKTRSGPALPDTLANKRSSEPAAPAAVAPQVEEKPEEPEVEEAPAPVIELKLEPVPPVIEKPAKKIAPHSVLIYTQDHCDPCVKLKRKWGDGDEYVSIIWKHEECPTLPQSYPAIRWVDHFGEVRCPMKPDPDDGNKLKYFVPDTLKELGGIIERSNQHG